jgi:hypothetical protein
MAPEKTLTQNLSRQRARDDPFYSLVRVDLGMDNYPDFFDTPVPPFSTLPNAREGRGKGGFLFNS